jgi:hypothetical protein
MSAARNNLNDCARPLSRSCDAALSVVTKEEWIQLYTSRILRAWFRQSAPLGLAWTYADWIRKDLSNAYNHPLTRAFIEETY